MSRHHIFVRPAREGEGRQFVEWSKATPNNLFDCRAPLYPTTTTRVAYDKSGALVYVPVQRPLMLEALAIRPGLDEITTAQALKELTQDAVTAAHDEGRGEIYFLCTDELTIEFAKRQAWEEVPYRVFRIRLGDLE